MHLKDQHHHHHPLEVTIPHHHPLTTHQVHLRHRPRPRQETTSPFKGGRTKEEAYEEADQAVEKMKIEFESPLRQEQTRSYQVPNVEETFTKGGEIKDDLSINP